MKLKNAYGSSTYRINNTPWWRWIDRDLRTRNNTDYFSRSKWNGDYGPMCSRAYFKKGRDNETKWSGNFSWVRPHCNGFPW